MTRPFAINASQLSASPQLAVTDGEAAPLRLLHVGPFMIGGGAERAFLDVARFFDPQRVQVVRSIVTNADMFDPAVAAEAPFPVELGGADAVRRAVRDCDLLLFWGLPLDDWLADGPLPGRPARPLTPTLSLSGGEGRVRRLRDQPAPPCPPAVFVAQGETSWTRDMLQGSARVVTHVIAVSRRVQQRVCDGFPSTVIFNGVDAARLAPTRSRDEVRHRLGFRPGDFVLAYVGRFADEKRLQRLIEAVARLPRRFKALFVGWGYRHAELLESAGTEIPGRFAVVKADRDLGDYYHAMDALCLLSEHEGCPLVVFEAMLCGRPVIATPVGSIPETIRDRVNGIVVPGDAASVAAAALLLQRHPDWARGLAREGKRFAERHGLARRTSRLYEELLLQVWTDRTGAARKAADRVPKIV